MRATERKVWRKLQLAASALVPTLALLADVHSDTVAVFANMAAALADSNVSEFMKPSDKEMPGYDTLKAEIASLITQYQVSSSIEPMKEEGDDSKRSVDLDWYLQIRSQLDNGPITVRRKVIHCELRKEGKHWQIVSLQPIDFFAPAKVEK